MNFETKEDFAHYTAALAQRAILYEVTASPKPGLVDRYNSGAHKDMDFYTFMASSSALYRGLYECTFEGLSFEDKDSTLLMDRIRKPGMECEKAMFEATNGVNTHKGIIFSMGTICAVVGKLYNNAENIDFSVVDCRNGITEFFIEDICEEVKKTTSGLIEKDFKNLQNKENLTHGEMLYRKYGLKGIRGEVESGFSTIRKHAVPLLRKWKTHHDLPMNHLFLELLINLMADSEDTNVIIRGGFENLEYVKSCSKEFLLAGGMQQENWEEKLQLMNTEFIARNISPGGSADLLAVTVFLGMLEGLIK